MTTDTPQTIAPLLAEAIRLQRAGQMGEAEPLFRRVLEIDAAQPDALHCLGVMAYAAGRTEEGIDLVTRAIAIEGKVAAYHSNLGLMLQQQGDLDAAIDCYQRAIALKPTDIHPHKNLGTALMELGRAEEAANCCRRALSLAPGFADAHTNLIYALNFIPGTDTAQQQAQRKRWYEAVARGFARGRRFANDGDRKKTKLRIGYVSAHFRHQAATYAFAPVILTHDREGFEVVCYSDTQGDDDLTLRLKSAATAWRPTATLNDDQLAAQIRADQVDILVDCVGHMQGHRLLMFARKPAPLQMTAWGEPTGTGLPAMDYLLADPVLVPAAERPLFAEKIADLPCFLSFWSPEVLPPPGPLPALAAGGITFGSFNRSGKLTEPTLKMWAEILARVPSARLLLKDRQLSTIAIRRRLMERLAANGIAADRVSLLAETTRDEHFAAYRSVDLCLDPTPHGGGMTTLDALAMGLPVITLRGHAPSGRLAAAVLSALDLAEWIANDPADYVAKAVALAADRGRLAEFRAQLRPRLVAAELGDPVRYTRAVEVIYRRAHAAWCDEKPPAVTKAGVGNAWGSPLGWAPWGSQPK